MLFLDAHHYSRLPLRLQGSRVLDFARCAPCRLALMVEEDRGGVGSIPKLFEILGQGTEERYTQEGYIILADSRSRTMLMVRTTL